MEEKLKMVELLAQLRGNIEGIAEGLTIHDGFTGVVSFLMDCAEAMETVMKYIKNA